MEIVKYVLATVAVWAVTSFAVVGLFVAARWRITESDGE